MITLKKLIPGIAWFFLVLILICLPGNRFPKTDNWLDLIWIDKWVHAGLFGVLAFLFMKPFTNAQLPQKDGLQVVLKIALSVSVWGLATEFIQKFLIPFRAFDLWDWAADSLGAAIAYIIARRIIKRTNPSQQ